MSENILLPKNRKIVKFSLFKDVIFIPYDYNIDNIDNMELWWTSNEIDEISKNFIKIHNIKNISLLGNEVKKILANYN